MIDLIERLPFIHGMRSNAMATLIRLVSGANATWVGCEPDPRRLRVYFANHGSHLDFAALWSALPADARGKTRPVAARDYWGRTRLTLAFMRTFNGVLIPREGISRTDNPIEKMARVMREGHSLILFPEGTRSRDGEMAEFKPGLYHLAAKVPEAELVPVYLQNLNRILPKGHLLPIPLMSSVIFGPPIMLQEGEAKQAFLRRAKQAVLDLMPRTAPPATDPFPA